MPADPANVPVADLAAALGRISLLETELAQAQSLLQHQACTDAVTGATNRAGMVALLEKTITNGGDGRALPTMLAVGLGAFSNAKLGRAGGKAVLQEAARRLQALAGSCGTVARMGNEEFAVLLPGGDYEGSLRLAVQLVTALSGRMVLGEHTLWLEPCVGIRFGATGLSAEEQIRDAVLAANHAEAHEQDHIQVFVPAMLERATQRVQMIADLHEAISADELELHYQPVVDLSSGRMVGAEALVRWQHPQWGQMQSAVFLPAAEEGGLMVALGHWVLATAVRQLGEWSPLLAALPAFRVHVNLSPGELERPQIVGEIRKLLAKHQVPAGRLALELTESAIVSDFERTAKVLLGLRKLGVGLEIDDFGTGYSSISYLRSLPVDTAKIDRSLVTGVDTDPRQQEFVAAILMLIKAARLDVVAEGIETAGQALALANMGAGLGQGYHFSKPVPVDRLTAMLEAGTTFAIGEPVASAYEV
ncbi:putative bifunctional diguanylate cyclase/phosphodiesterase [Pseudarthrobacter sp. P1]|uniref:putative bifunctional diguanylate cyclase/phosphodiesterase n=1 Tax=Pseudarthrobacter sp. P1 TaxID=3418418 RepID=UPI003CEFEBCB